MSGFPRKVDENGALLSYYAASSGNSLPTFLAKIFGPMSLPNSPEKRSSRAQVVSRKSFIFKGQIDSMPAHTVLILDKGTLGEVFLH